MARTNRIALFASLALIVALAGTALATRAPQTSDEPAQLAASHEAEPENEAENDGEDGPAVAIDRLSEAGIEVDAAVFEDLATRYGQGGAVRLYAWADATDYSVDEIAAMRDGDGEPVGWGRLAKDLGVHPGIGSIMGRGNAPDGPPGQQKRDPDDADD
jgi:hypothetical protein